MYYICIIGSLIGNIDKITGEIKYLVKVTLLDSFETTSNLPKYSNDIPIKTHILGVICVTIATQQNWNYSLRILINIRASCPIPFICIAKSTIYKHALYCKSRVLKGTFRNVIFT